MLISVIIPTLNDAAFLPVTLRQLAERDDVELIVVDGGSTDSTAAVARHFTPYVFVSPTDRADRLNSGARHATGDILLFLDPDAFLLPGALEELMRRIIGDGAVGGAFDLAIDSPRRWFRLMAWVRNQQARILRRPSRDQALFCWRQVFEALDGFPKLPILEDVAFARRLRRAGRLTFLRTGVVTSAHRWLAAGPVRTLVVRAGIAALAGVGLPHRLQRRWHDAWLRRPSVSAGLARRSTAAAGRSSTG